MLYRDNLLQYSVHTTRYNIMTRYERNELLVKVYRVRKVLKKYWAMSDRTVWPNSGIATWYVYLRAEYNYLTSLVVYKIAENQQLLEYAERLQVFAAVLCNLDGVVHHNTASENMRAKLLDNAEDLDYVISEIRADKPVNVFRVEVYQE